MCSTEADVRCSKQKHNDWVADYFCLRSSDIDFSYI
jgi:hypothetical protein